MAITSTIDDIMGGTTAGGAAGTGVTSPTSVATSDNTQLGSSRPPQTVSAVEGSSFANLSNFVLQDPNATGLNLTDTSDYAKAQAMFAKSMGGLETAVDKLQPLADKYLKGELPEDTMAAIRQATSEAAEGKGIFGQAGRALTARDLGLQSLQVQAQGTALQGQIANIHQTAASLSEQHRQFNKQYDLNVSQFQQDVRKTNLSGLALEQDRQQFNAKQNLLITQNIMDMVSKQQQLGYQYAAINVDSSGSMETMTNWIKELQSQLTGGV